LQRGHTYSFRGSEAKSGTNHPLFGKSHSDETRAKISEALTGKTYSFNRADPTASRHGAKISEAHTGKTLSTETRAQMSKSQQLVDRSGANHHMYGKVAANAMTIYIYSLDNVPVQTFSSMTAAAKFLNTSSSAPIYSQWQSFSIQISYFYYYSFLLVMPLILRDNPFPYIANKISFV